MLALIVLQKMISKKIFALALAVQIACLTITSCVTSTRTSSNESTYKNDFGDVFCKKHHTKLQRATGYSLDHKLATVSFDDAYIENHDRYPNYIKPTISEKRNELSTIKVDYAFCQECEKLMQEAVALE